MPTTTVLFERGEVEEEKYEVACPCCGRRTLEERGWYNICVLCWWEDCGQDNHNADQALGGPNKYNTLSRARYETLKNNGVRRLKHCRDYDHFRPDMFEQDRVFVIDGNRVREPEVGWVSCEIDLDRSAEEVAREQWKELREEGILKRVREYVKNPSKNLFQFRYLVGELPPEEFLVQAETVGDAEVAQEARKALMEDFRSPACPLVDVWTYQIGEGFVLEETYIEHD